MCTPFNKQSFFEEYLNLTDKPCLDESQVEFFEIIDSTNSYLLKKAQENCMSPFLAAAESQTCGRGRMGRAFYSPQKTGIYFSILVTPDKPVEDPALYTISSVAGVCRAIEKIFGVHCSIKWVNDIYVNEKKVCGILTEGVVDYEKNCIRSVVIGIGINIIKNELQPPELENKASGIMSNENDCGSQPAADARSKLLACCVNEIFKILETSENIYDYYSERSFLKNKKVVVTPLIGDTKNDYAATVKGISPDFGLEIILDDGTKKILRTGEVSLHQTL